MTTNAATHVKRRHEAPEVAAAARRFINALVRRSAEGDTEALEGLIGLQSHLQTAITEAGQRMHDEAGFSYTYLAEVMGITRQGARQRFTTPERCPHGKTGLSACVPCHEESLTGDLIALAAEVNA